MSIENIVHSRIFVFLSVKGFQNDVFWFIIIVIVWYG